jgi:hypothetical protein
VHLHLLRSEPIQGFLSRFVSADPSSTHRYIEQGELVLADDSNKLLDKPRPRDYVNAGSSTAIRRQEESLEAEAIQRCQVMLRNLYLLSRTSGNLHAFDVAGRIALGGIGAGDHVRQRWPYPHPNALPVLRRLVDLARLVAGENVLIAPAVNDLVGLVAVLGCRSSLVVGHQPPVALDVHP